MITRRSVLAASVAISATSFVPAFAGIGNVGLLDSVADLIGKCAESVSKLGDSFAHLTSLGVKGYDSVAARREYNTLLELRAVTQDSIVAYGPLIRSMEDYVEAAKNPDHPHHIGLDEGWRDIKYRIDAAARLVSDLLTKVRQTRNDFVLEDAYRSLQEALEGRSELLGRLTQIEDPPTTPDELESLRQIAVNYRELLRQSQKATDELAAYIKTMKRKR